MEETNPAPGMHMPHHWNMYLLSLSETVTPASEVYRPVPANIQYLKASSWQKAKNRDLIHTDHLQERLTVCCVYVLKPLQTGKPNYKPCNSLCLKACFTEVPCRNHQTSVPHLISWPWGWTSWKHGKNIIIFKSRKDTPLIRMFTEGHTISWTTRCWNRKKQTWDQRLESMQCTLWERKVRNCFAFSFCTNCTWSPVSNWGAFQWNCKAFEDTKFQGKQYTSCDYYYCHVVSSKAPVQPVHLCNQCQ